MNFFKDFKYANYIFGEEGHSRASGDVITELFTNLAQYVEVLDSVKVNNAYHTKYYIQEGERPDQVSMKIYGVPYYHWTFFMMNDNLREQGWPLTYRQLDEVVKRDFPHTTCTTTDDLTGHFLPGERVIGSTSGARGNILRRNLDLGQIIIEQVGTVNFSSREVITSSNVNATKTQSVLVDTVAEYNAIHHYENAAGEWVDIDPFVGNPGIYTAVTNYDRYVKQNDQQKEINVIKPNNVIEVANLYKQALNS